ncbi:MAG: GWxTD domain-containing protein [Acidobacteriota bacterium]|nr:MAG: GWxTD domain-containing protein [Acidobacteriota bacterium]
MNPTRFLFLLGLSVGVFVTSALAQSNREQIERQQQEESLDYFQKWLEEDVVYIITDEERSIFTKLSTIEEKEQFIEQFWRRRDDDLRTTINEFKEEHYRRITYSNEHFTSAIPGWKTDRGRVYILHGPPQEIESRPTGGAYIRPLHEGGGTTGTYPFEIWRYRQIDGVGTDIELEFVDPTYSEEFRLALRPEEKDAFLNVQGGYTTAEEMGLREKSERPYFRPNNTSLLRDYPYMFTRAKDMPFQRYETYAFINKAPEIKYKDLKELVNVNISYRELPMRVRKDYFRLNDIQALIPITIEFPNQELSYNIVGDNQVAKVAIYAIVTDLSNRIVAEFEDEIVTSFPTADQTKGLQRRSIYQKILTLNSNSRYKMDLVLKDQRSGKVGVTREAIVPQATKGDQLAMSSMILSNAIRPLSEIPENDQMFVIGDVWVLPIMNKVFFKQEPLGLYVHLYGAGMDQSTFEPSLVVNYQVLQNGEPVAEFTDDKGLTIQYFSPRRIVLIGGVPVNDLTPGKYQVQITVTDLITDRMVAVVDEFELKEAFQMAGM